MHEASSLIATRRLSISTALSSTCKLRNVQLASMELNADLVYQIICIKKNMELYHDNGHKTCRRCINLLSQVP